MKYMIIFFLLFPLTSFAKKVEVKKRSTVVIADIKVPSEFEIKKNLFNTPLLIWHKKYKHSGPTLALFPLKKAPLGHGSKKAIKTNFKKFKKEMMANLKSLDATEIKFINPVVVSDTTRFEVLYTMSKLARLHASETQKRCKNGSGLTIKTLLKQKQVKEFKTLLLKTVDSVTCD